MPVTTPPSLPGELALWSFDEGSGGISQNYFADTPNAGVNLLTAPEQLFNSTLIWSKNGSFTVTDKSHNNPNAVQLASRVQFTAGYTALETPPTASRPTTIPAGTYTLSVYAKSNDGGDRSIRLGVQTTNADYHVGTVNVPNASGWVRGTLTFTAAHAINYIFIDNAISGSNQDVLLWGAQLEAAGSVSAYVLPDFEMRLGIGATRPTWTAEGLTADSGDLGVAIGQSYPTFAEQSGYMCVRIDDAAASRVSIRDFLSLPASSPGFVAGAFNSQGANRQGVTVASSELRNISPIVDSKYHVLAWTWDGATLSYYLDGTMLRSVDASTGWTSTGFLFGDLDLPFVGKRGPHAIYTEAHTGAEVRQMTDWIASEMAARSVTVNDLQVLVCLEGDSITEIFGDWGAYSYTFQTLQGLTPVQMGVNYGISGSKLSGENPSAPDINDRAAVADALLSPAKEYPIFSAFVGTNELFVESAEDTFTRYMAYVDDRTAAGWYVIAWKILPRNTVGFEAKRQAFNTLLEGQVGSGRFVYLVDTDTKDVGDQANFATHYLDGLHPNEAGHTDLKDLAIDAIEWVLANLPPMIDPAPATNTAIIGGGFGPFYGDG